MLFFDPLYLIIVGPAILFGIVAQIMVSSAFGRYSKVRAASALTGHELAERLLRDGNARAALVAPGHEGQVSQALSQVRVECVSGKLSDHYDPSTRVLRLSDPVYASDSLAALGVAAHETGHAFQHAERYGPLALRSAIVPAVNFGASIWPVVFIGYLFTKLPILINLGIVIFAGVLVFSLITLPVELNASARAMRLLTAGGYVTPDEARGVRRVLTAAALTYVAATVSAFLTLACLLLLRNRR